VVCGRPATTRLNRRVAIKTLPPASWRMRGRQRRFIQRRRPLPPQRPNIVTSTRSLRRTAPIHRHGVRGRQRRWASFIPKRGMRLEETLRYAIQMAGALAKAHAGGIVHRDPEARQHHDQRRGGVKLLDFGAGKLTEANRRAARTKTPHPASALRGGHHRRHGRLHRACTTLETGGRQSPWMRGASDSSVWRGCCTKWPPGTRAFHGDSKLSTLSAVLREKPSPQPG